MFSSALFWSGNQLCDALNSLGVSETTISACGENQQIMGFLAVAWFATMVIVWKFMLGRMR
jgi:hypothetical protein